MTFGEAIFCGKIETLEGHISIENNNVRFHLQKEKHGGCFLLQQTASQLKTAEISSGGEKEI